jgi:hypothetical protein
VFRNKYKKGFLSMSTTAGGGSKRLPDSENFSDTLTFFLNTLYIQLAAFSPQALN